MNHVPPARPERRASVPDVKTVYVPPLAAARLFKAVIKRRLWGLAIPLLFIVPIMVYVPQWHGFSGRPFTHCRIVRADSGARCFLCPEDCFTIQYHTRGFRRSGRIRPRILNGAIPGIRFSDRMYATPIHSLWNAQKKGCRPGLSTALYL